MSKEKLTATHIKYDNGKVLTDFAKYDNEGNEIANTYAKKKYTQETLLSGYNIKTINGESILGSGNITIAESNPVTNTSQLENDSGFLTEHQSLAGLATEQYVDNAINEILGEGQIATNFDTIKEVADYLTQHGSDYTALVSAVNDKANTADRNIFTSIQDFRSGINVGNVNGGWKIYQDGSGFLRLGSGDTDVYKIGNDLIWPIADNNIDLGGEEHRLKDIYLSGALKDGTNTFTLPSSAGTLALQSELLLPSQFYFAYSKTSSYRVGDCRSYNGKFYICKVNIDYPSGEWDSEKWTEITFGSFAIGLTANSLFGVSLNSLGAAKANNPEASMYWKNGNGIIKSYHRNINDDTYVYFENLSVSGNTLTKDTIRVKKENGNMYQYTESAGLLPTPPTTDGTYTLEVTVSNGTPTYSWVLKQ